MYRNVVVSGVLLSSVFWFSYKVLDTEAPMLALPLRLPTAPYGGHMGHFLLSILALMGSTPLGNIEYGFPLRGTELEVPRAGQASQTL